MRPVEQPIIRILLLEDEALVRAALQKLLESWAGFEVIREAPVKDFTSELNVGSDPDVVLLSLQGEHDTDLDVIQGLARTYSRGRVLVLVGECSVDFRIRIIKMGARGVVLKNKQADELRKAIETVHGSDEVWLDRKSLTHVITQSGLSPALSTAGEDSRLALLTDREREVVSLVAEGFKNKEVGERLFISETTVRHHLTTIFNKLNVSSRFELIAFLHRNRSALPPRPNPSRPL